MSILDLLIVLLPEIAVQVHASVFYLLSTIMAHYICMDII